LATISADEGGKAVLEANLEDVTDKLKQANQQYVASAWDEKIQKCNTQLRALDDQSEALNRELIQGTKQAGKLAELELLKKSSKDRERSLETMAGAHGARLRETLGHGWQPASLEADFQRVIDSRKRQVTEAERFREGISRELEQVEFRLTTARADAKKKEQESNKCTGIIRDLTNGEPEDYPENLELTQTDRDTRKSDVEAFSNMKNWYVNCIDTAKAEVPACRLCSRPFHDEKSARQFIAKLEKKVSKGVLDVMQKELRELDVELQKAKDANSSYDTWKRLCEIELPSLRIEMSRLEEQRDGLVRQLEEHGRIITEREEARKDAETLLKPVANMVKYSNEFENLQSQVRELSAKQKYEGLSRPLEDVQEEIEAVATESRIVRASISKLQSDEKQSRAQITTSELKLSSAKSELMKADHEMEKKTSILMQIEDVKKSNQQQREALISLETQLQQLIPKFLEEEAKRDDLKQRGYDKNKELEEEAVGLSDSLRSLERADRDIKAYIQEGGPEKLARCQQDIQAFEDEIVLLQTEVKHITVEINKIKDELGNSEQNKRIIADNLNYRKTRRQLDAVREEIEKTSRQSAEADQQHHRDQAERWQRKHTLLTTEETSKTGMMKAKDDQLMQLLNDWNTDYKDAAGKYKKSHIEVEVC
jgi:DNA repair protein RAD50